MANLTNGRKLADHIERFAMNKVGVDIQGHIFLETPSIGFNMGTWLGPVVQDNNGIYHRLKDHFNGCGTVACAKGQAYLIATHFQPAFSNIWARDANTGVYSTFHRTVDQWLDIESSTSVEHDYRWHSEREGFLRIWVGGGYGGGRDIDSLRAGLKLSDIHPLHVVAVLRAFLNSCESNKPVVDWSIGARHTLEAKQEVEAHQMA